MTKFQPYPNLMHLKTTSYMLLKALNLSFIGKKTLWKRRKCWLPAYSPFPTMLSKGFILNGIKSCHCLVKGSTAYSRFQSCFLLKSHIWVCIYRPFFGTFLVFFSKIFLKFECNTTSDWLNHIWFNQSEVVLHSNAAK